MLVSLSMIQAALEKIHSFNFVSKMICVSFDLYAGWIIAATILNISSALVFSNWNRFGITDTVWTGIILIVGAIIGSLPAILKRRYEATLAVIWTYFGIMVKQGKTALFTVQETNIFSLSVVGTVMMIFFILFMILFQKTDRSNCRFRVR